MQDRGVSSEIPGKGKKREENETRVEKQKVEKEGEKYLPERRKREGMCVCLSL